MAKSKIIHEASVNLHTASYPIFVGTNLLDEETLLQRFVVSKQVFVVTNETVAPLYLEKVLAAFGKYQTNFLILKDGEAYKNQSSLFQIFDALIQFNHHRDTTLVALGGGVIGDLVGFAASTYQRGVPFIQLPTTLLAQVDASVGGKTAINYGQIKNNIGTFYQPRGVVIDVNTLKSLPEREFNAGLAEIIKYGLLESPLFLDKLTHLIDDGFTSAKTEVLADLIHACCLIKAKFVETDERESDHRAMLNLGHTFAHALEAITHYDHWLHGEAVGIGLYCAALLSNQLGYLDAEAVQHIDQLLARAKLPRRIPKTIDLEQLCELMAKDKKIQNKQLRFVLMKEIGNCYLDNSVPDQILRRVLTKAVEGDMQ